MATETRPEKTANVEAAVLHAEIISSVLLQETISSQPADPERPVSATAVKPSVHISKTSRHIRQKAELSLISGPEPATNAPEEAPVDTSLIDTNPVLRAVTTNEIAPGAELDDSGPSEATANNNENAPQLAALESFVDALQLATYHPEGEAWFGDPAASETSPEAILYTSDVAKVAEQLANLDPADKLIAAPIAQDITATLRFIQTLRTEAAPNAQIMAAEKKLAELTTQLFEVLGMEYDEAKVRRFVQHLLKPGFIERLANSDETAIEGIGTHEIKRYLRELLSTLGSLLPQPTTHQLLGTLAISVY